MPAIPALDEAIDPLTLPAPGISTFAWGALRVQGMVRVRAPQRLCPQGA